MNGNHAIDRITNIRNGIEHIDDDIKKGKIQEGQPSAILIKSDSIELLEEEIFYCELANWIKELHGLALELSNYQEHSI